VRATLPGHPSKTQLTAVYPCHRTLHTAQVHQPSCQWLSWETVCSLPQRMHLGLLTVFVELVASAI
jgi:hypothetical protein